nr:carbonyl reductase [NADPH] 1-like isoform X1 [Onthophagus taurus]
MIRMALNTSRKVAIVTGSNKGIGYAIVKGLCDKFDGVVYLTARNSERGIEAVKKLKDAGFNPLFHQLDVDNQESVNKFRDFIKNEHGGVDLLINNAAIAYNQDSKEPFSKQASDTIKTNYFGLLRVCEAFFPLLRKDARVVNVSSSAGHLARIPSIELRAKFSDSNLTVEKLSTLMNEFVKCREEHNDTVTPFGWNDSAYVVSKVGVSALTRIQQKEFNLRRGDLNVSVNSVHPGFVDTDMTDHQGVLTIEQGAEPILYLALEQHGFKGEYVWCDSKVVDWLGLSTPTPV